MDSAQKALFGRRKYEKESGLWLFLTATTAHHTFQATVREGILDTVLIYASGKKKCLEMHDQKNAELPFFEPWPFQPSSRTGQILGQQFSAEGSLPRGLKGKRKYS